MFGVEWQHAINIPDQGRRRRRGLRGTGEYALCAAIRKVSRHNVGEPGSVVRQIALPINLVLEGEQRCAGVAGVLKSAIGQG